MPAFNLVPVAEHAKVKLITWLHSGERETVERMVQDEIDSYTWKLGAAQAELPEHPNMEEEIKGFQDRIQILKHFLLVMQEYAQKETFAKLKITQ